jgi:pilus assembly protein CpaB
MLRLMLFTVALLAGGAAAWLALSGQSGASNNVRANEDSPLVDVLLASADIEQGGVLTLENLRWQPWPKDLVKRSFIVRAERPEATTELSGSIARNHIFAGEIILAEKFAPPGSGFLSAVLSSGKRAVAVRVSAESSAGGFIRPNDRVDVLHTVPCQAQDACQSGNVVRTILRNVRVLAIDQVGTRDDSETVIVGKTATLELEPWQAETIVSAEASGMLTLVLRPSTENSEQIDLTKPQTRTVRVNRKGESEYVTVQQSSPTNQPTSQFQLGNSGGKQ